MSLNVELTAKRLGLLRELAPQATRFVALVNRNAVMTEAIIKDVQASIQILGFPVEIVYADDSDRDIEAAFADLSQKPGSALLVNVDPFFFTRRALIVTLAARHAIPAVYFRREFAEIGGLLSYGTSVDNIHELVGIYTGRVLKGEKPADLPVMQPTDLGAPCPVARFPAPKRPKTGALPSQNGLRLNHPCCTEQARPEPGHPDQQRAVTAVEPRTRRRSPQGDAELMAQGQVLGFQPAPRLEQVDDEHSERMQEREHRP